MVEQNNINRNKANVDISGFPDRLKELRFQKKLTQEELGEKANVHYSHIGKYERGLSNPSLETVKLLADALEVSVDYLVFGSLEAAAKANLSDRDLLKFFKEAEELSEKDKVLVKEILDAFLTKKKLQKQLAS